MHAHLRDVGERMVLGGQLCGAVEEVLQRMRKVVVHIVQRLNCVAKRGNSGFTIDRLVVLYLQKGHTYPRSA